MYKALIRPLLFKLQPESAHHLIFNNLKLGQKLGLQHLIAPLYKPKSLDTPTEFCGLTFPNKVGIAAGLDKNAEAFEILGSFGFGHVEIGTVTPKGQPGNPKPRSFRLVQDGAIINRMGFNNHGLTAAVDKLRKRNKKLIIGGNIGKNTATPNEDALQDYVDCFRGLYDHVDYLVINVSCPNITNLHKLQDQDQLEMILSTLNAERNKAAVRKPIMLKIAPDLNEGQLDETLEVVKRNDIDAVIATNTTTTRNNLSTDAEKVKQIGNGGLSGKPIKDRSTEVIRYISKKTNGELPIIGVGGIFTAQDAIDKLEAGASLVQVYTGFIYEGVGIAKKINKAVKDKY